MFDVLSSCLDRKKRVARPVWGKSEAQQLKSNEMGLSSLTGTLALDLDLATDTPVNETLCSITLTKDRPQDCVSHGLETSRKGSCRRISIYAQYDKVCFFLENKTRPAGIRRTHFLDDESAKFWSRPRDLASLVAHLAKSLCHWRSLTCSMSRDNSCLVSTRARSVVSLSSCPLLLLWIYRKNSLGILRRWVIPNISYTVAVRALRYWCDISRSSVWARPIYRFK